jgi:Ku protein
MASTIRNLTVSFGLVEFPASLRKASEKRDVTFDSAVRTRTEDGYVYERVAQRRVGASSGSVAATATTNGDGNAEIVKGVWVSEDQFNPLPEGALDAIMAAGEIAGIEIEDFVPLKAVPWHRVEGAYYLTPQKGLIGAKPMRLLRDALRGEKAAGVAKLCLKGSGGRQRLGVIHEADGMLLVNLLAFAEDFRDADESARSVENVDVNKDMLKLARQMIRERVGPESALLTSAVDSTVAEREKLYLDTFEGEGYTPPKANAKAAAPAHDLMAQLQASLEALKVDA